MGGRPQNKKGRPKKCWDGCLTMCRYDSFSNPYKTPYVCFTCRLHFHGVSTCPVCREEMTWMGQDFKPPRRSNVKQWKKVQLLAEKGKKFQSCGCIGPGYSPRNVREARELLKIPVQPRLERKYNG